MIFTLFVLHIHNKQTLITSAYIQLSNTYLIKNLKWAVNVTRYTLEAEVRYC